MRLSSLFQAQAVLDGPNERRYKHTLDAALTIYRQEGLRAFYKGLTPSLIGVSHVAVQFPLYEQLKVWAGEFAKWSSVRAPRRERDVFLKWTFFCLF